MARMKFLCDADRCIECNACVTACKNEIERSPGLPSLMVTTRRRLMPHGTSCSFLQAVTQALHSMQRSASQRNFIRAIVEPPYTALIWQSVALGSCIPVTGS